LDANFWRNHHSKISPIIIDNENPIENLADSLIVDFANKFIGGAALSFGAV
jgi:hypothetical protein